MSTHSHQHRQVRRVAVAFSVIATKHAYRPAVDERERAGLVAMLNTCGGAR